MSDSTIQYLLSGVAEGNEKSFRRLFELYKQRIYAYAMHFTRSVAISEEIVQDIFMKLWLHKEELREVKRFEAYLYTITRNLCFDYLKKIAHEQAIRKEWFQLVKVSSESTQDIVNYHHCEKLIHDAFELLPPKQKEAYTLSLFHGRKPEEIAQFLHVSRNTVKAHLVKARATVRKYIAAHLEMAVLLLITLFHRF